MSNNEVQVVTPIAANMEDAAKVVAALAVADGDDFRVKILFRVSMAAPQESIAIFDGATTDHLMNPEPWMQRFVGGSGRGTYTFRVVHGKDRSADRPCAIYQIPGIRGDARLPDVKAAKSPDWNGPRELVFAMGQDINAPSNGVPSRTPPLADPVANPLPGSTQVRPGQSDGVGLFLAEIQRERAKLDEDRHQMEIAAIRNAHSIEMKRLESKIGDLAESMKHRPEPTRTDLAETVTKIAAGVTAVLAPLLPILTASRESEKIREERREAREEANRSELLKLMKESADRAASASTDHMKMMAPMVESVAKMGQTVLNQVAMFRDITAQPQEEPSIMDLVKAGIAAWVESSARPAQGGMIPDPRLTQPPIQTPPPQTPPPVGDVTAQAQAQSQEDLEEVDVDPKEMLNALAQAVSKREPEAGLAEDVVRAMSEADFVQAIVTEGGILAVLKNRIPDAWSQDQANVAYLQRLFAAVSQLAKANTVDIRPLFPVAKT